MLQIMHGNIILFVMLHLCKYASCLVLLLFINESYPSNIWIEFVINISISMIILYMVSFKEWIYSYKINVLDILFGVVWYTFVLDSIFTIHHYVMHSNQYLYTTVHYIHHSSTGNLNTIKGMLSHPFDGFSVSILVIFTIITLEPNPISMCIAYSLFSIMGIILHSGYNQENIFWPFLVTPADHQRHHDCVTVNYGVFYSIWDRLSGTYSNINC